MSKDNLFIKDLNNNSIKDISLLLFKNLNNKRKRSIYKLFFSQILSGLLEMATLVSILPFINAITNINNLYENQYTKKIIKLFNIYDESNLLLLTLVFFIIFIIFANLIKFYNLWLSNKVSAEIGSDLSSKVYSNILNSNYEYHLNINSSDIIATISNYIIKAIDFIYSFLQLLASLIICVSITVTLFIYNWLIAFSVALIFGCIYGLIIVYFKKYLISNSKRIVRETNSQIKLLQEGMGGIRDIILDDMQLFFSRIFTKSDYKLRIFSAQNSTISGFPKFGVEACGFILIAFIAYFLVINGKSSSYIFSALGIIALGTQRLLPSCQMIFYSWSSIQGSKESITQVLKLINEKSKPQIKYSKNLISFKKDIILKDLSFRYKGTDKYIIENSNLRIKKGETIGIIGETGSGKSTIVDILMGLLRPSKGTLMVDGKDINKSNKHLISWRKKIAHVPQNIFLSDSTISENIAFGIGTEYMDIEKIKKSCKDALLLNFINNLPFGLNTKVGEMGAKISGGQKQRIGIARAFYKDKEILILDEATSALDSVTEKYIMESVKKFSKKMTVIIIAHRKSTLNNCDRILIVKNNQIIE
tara:strand:+ start:98 stop:1867 length:1770 start_codon:yes stop_codon:yes gene_type:complete